MTEQIAYCPDHPNVPMGKAGKVYFGRTKVQRWRCKVDGSTTTKPIFKDAGDYGKPNVEMPEGEEEPTFASESTYETPQTPAYETPAVPTYKPPRKKRKKSTKSFDDISIGKGGMNIGDISKGGSLDSMSL